MRSKKYWALAREDGSLEFGSTRSWLDHHPRWNIFLVRSVVAFIEMVIFSTRMFARNPMKFNRTLVKWIVLYLAITVPLSILLKGWIAGIFGAGFVFQLLIFSLALIAISRSMPERVWTYHGAEHKAVNAYEQGRDLEDVEAVQQCSRIHPRCGTNLVVLIMLLSSLYFPVPGSQVALVTSAAYSVFAVALSLEIFKQLLRFPRALVTRMLLFGGYQMQRWVTTREPADDQVEVASKALRMVLALEALGQKD